MCQTAMWKQSWTAVHMKDHNEGLHQAADGHGAALLWLQACVLW